MTEAKSRKKGGQREGAFSPEANKRKIGDDSDKQSASNKKRALKHERQSRRKHADVVVASKELWNKLRLKSNSKDDIAEMMRELMQLLRGKFAQVAMQHDASRVVQAAIQFGTTDQRAEIVKELEGDTMAELAKVQYAHFVILKCIKYCAKDIACVKVITKSLKGQMAKLAVHSVGARVVELLFGTFSPKSTSLLKLELYGPQFALFSSGKFSNANSNQPTLQKLLRDQPDKRDVAIEHTLDIVNKGIEKGLFGFAYFQELIHEYFNVATPNEIRSIASSLVDHSIHLLSTRPGALVVAGCVTYGTQKDRKRIMRSLKGYTRSSLLHRDAYIAVLRLVDVTDDTVLVKKSVLNELQVNPDENEEGMQGNRSPILDLALSETGSKLFLMLLLDDIKIRHRYFDPAELEVLQPNPTIVEGGEEVPTSKKAFSVRREELLQFMKNVLTELCIRHAGELLRSIPGSKVLREVFRMFPSSDLALAVVEACSDSLKLTSTSNDGMGEDSNLSLFEHPVGHLALKHVILDESRTASVQSDVTLSKLLLEKFKGSLMQIASSNRGAFVVGALVKVKFIEEHVVSELKMAEPEISKLAKGKERAGYEALLHLIA